MPLIRTPRREAMLKELADRVHLYLLLRDFRPSELISFFEHETGAAYRAKGYRDEQCWADLDRQLERGLITRGEYAREQWWAEVATCAAIALQRNSYGEVAVSWMWNEVM